ncbi:MAG TPA: DUF4229 domain-containing protein [Marmoricola sp.]|nr:DUF4229 domain-containing protein [Marmoricola sp.]
MKDFVVYTVLRIGLFLACFAVVSTIAVNVVDNSSTVWIWSIVGSAVLSSLLSLRLLAGPRERFAASVHRRAERASAAMERARSKEDID